MTLGLSALYLMLFAALAGYLLIERVPSLLHTPLLSGSNFIHGVVLLGGIEAIGHAEGNTQLAMAVIATVLAAANLVGGFLVTDRMLQAFEQSARERESRRSQRQGGARTGHDDSGRGGPR